MNKIHTSLTSMPCEICDQRHERIQELMENYKDIPLLRTLLSQLVPKPTSTTVSSSSVTDELFAILPYTLWPEK